MHSGRIVDAWRMLRGRIGDTLGMPLEYSREICGMLWVHIKGRIEDALWTHWGPIEDTL